MVRTENSEPPLMLTLAALRMVTMLLHRLLLLL
jgi:hypothetical protein